MTSADITFPHIGKWETGRNIYQWINFCKTNQTRWEKHLNSTQKDSDIMKSAMTRRLSIKQTNINEHLTVADTFVLVSMAWQSGGDSSFTSSNFYFPYFSTSYVELVWGPTDFLLHKGPFCSSEGKSTPVPHVFKKSWCSSAPLFPQT